MKSLPPRKPRAAAARKNSKPAAPKASPKKSTAFAREDGTWSLRLYVAGQTARSATAFSNLKRICEERLPGRYKIEVIDLVKQPQFAQNDQIVAIPTLVRKLPEPIRRVVGDLSNLERVLVGMNLNEMASH